MDGDGVPDFAAGGPGEFSFLFPRVGMVRFCSGLDGSLIHHVDPPLSGEDKNDRTNFGDVIDGGGDLNGDGLGDLIVGEPAGRNFYSVLSGRTGSLLWRIPRKTNPNNGQMGWYVAMLDDLDGDGLAEFAVTEKGASYISNGSSGRLHIFKGAVGDAERTCAGAPNSTGRPATLTLLGPISVGNDALRFSVTGGPPGESGSIVYGPESASLPHGDGTLCVGGGAVGLTWLPEQLRFDASGTAEIRAHFRQPPIDQGPAAWSAGSTWYVQGVYRDPAAGGAGFNTTSAWKITFLP